MFRQIMLRNDSRSSLVGVLDNIIQILWTRETARKMTPVQVMADDTFVKMWCFVLNRKDLMYRERREFKKLLLQWKKEKLSHHLNPKEEDFDDESELEETNEPK